MREAEKNNKLFVEDSDLRRRYGDGAEIIIDMLDRDTATQKGLAGVPFDKRPRLSVGKLLRAKGYLGVAETL